ncbi:uncharacterized protein LOC116848643 [Odontomachus brunneus]|uniref:uncharacterized protein LOC116848643 n=1 Tax=Odontomachus brunneus TaxID=486640 RepID=UPI0013F26A55|nr:uncharacterized protein LOC116848643 [Odontomachus brunneus]
MNDRHNSLDYKNISLMLTGEISSACIKRNNLMQPTKHTSVSFMDNMEDDDEKFILDWKKNIDKSSITTDVQGTSREHPEEVLKTFLRPQDVLRTSSKDLVLSGSFPTNATVFTPSIAFNNIDRNFRNKANRFLFHITSNMQKNPQVITPASKIFAETEIEEMIYYEMKYLTQPQKIN